MIKILTIIGARPQIIKAAAISRAIKNSFSKDIKEIILHTGQHYDHNMSEVFFQELGIPEADIQLNVGSASHGKQTAAMITGIEKAILETEVDYVLVYGDTNSTLAASIAASKIHIPIVHVEAGLRSFNKSMPEEINRILCDHTSSMLFSPTKAGKENLIREGFSEENEAPFTADNPGIFHCGDVMYDNSMYFSQISEEKTDIIKRLNVTKNDFVLCTIHRDSNTDNPEKLSAIFNALDSISKEKNIEIILPLHPRTSKLLEKTLSPEVLNKCKNNTKIRIIEPASFLEMIELEKNSKLIITDSGGVQKEAFFFKKACIILRPQTEWVEIVDAETAIIADTDEDKIISSFKSFYANPPTEFPAIFGDAKAADYILKQIIKNNS
jgi:UDP-GlcNAc3NAcA epimerase